MDKLPDNPADASPELIKRIIADSELRRQVTKKSHLWFFYIYFADYATHPIADYHKEIFAMTERGVELLSVLTAFRNSSKSTLVTLSYVLWSIFSEQQKKFVLIIGLTQPQASIHFMNVRDALENNELLHIDFGPYTLADGEWQASTIVLSKYNARISVASTDKNIRGIRHKQFRPDLIVLDDIEDINSVKTQDSRDKLYNWFKGEIIPLGDLSTRIILVGNLLHKDSLLMRLKSDITEGIIEGGYYEYPLVNAEGKILWPGKFPDVAAIERERRKYDPVTWAREFLLKIISSLDQVVQPGWIHYYSVIPAEVLRDYHQTLVSVDLAISQSDKADYTAMVPAIVSGNGATLKIYILPNLLNRRMTFPATVEHIEALYLQLQDNYSVQFLVEANGQQEALPQQLKIKGVPSVSIKVATDKRSRLALTADFIRSGKVLFPIEGSKQLINQVTDFDFEKHDDLADAFSLLINHIIISYKPIGTYGDDFDINASKRTPLFDPGKDWGPVGRGPFDWNKQF
jgi:predicted phage terminase large subunit-like protein